MKTMHRRSFLRGTAGAAIALPFLEAFDSHAGGSGVPKRLLFFCTNNGNGTTGWDPTGTSTDFQLGDDNAPLEPFKDRLVLLTGMNMESAKYGTGSQAPHTPGMASMLTGTEMIQGGSTLLAGGISVDQYIAQQLSPGTKFPTLSFGVQSQAFGDPAHQSISYTGPGEPVVAEDDPQKAWERLFADLDPGSSPGAERLSDQRRSVLDLVSDQTRDLQSRLGSADRARLEQHLDSLRTLEQGLDAGVAADCIDPGMPAALDLDAIDSAPDIMRQQTDLLVSALACDLTRIATLQWRQALAGDSTFTWLGHSTTHHDLSHDPSSSGQASMAQIQRWFAEQFAYLLERMDAVDEGDGSMLDHSIIVWCNPLATGYNHSHDGHRWIIAGGGDGTIQTGRWLDYDGDFHSNLLVSLCNAMDVPTDTFGDPTYCTGPLTGLL